MFNDLKFEMMEKPWLCSFKLPTWDEDWIEIVKKFGTRNEEVVETAFLRLSHDGSELFVVVDNGITYAHLPNLGFIHGQKEFKIPVTQERICKEIRSVYDLVQKYGSLSKAEKSHR